MASNIAISCTNKAALAFVSTGPRDHRFSPRCPAASAAGLPQPQRAPRGQSLGNGTATEGKERGKCVYALRKVNPKRILIVDAFYCEGGKTP